MPVDPHPPQPLSDLLNLCREPVLVVEPTTGRLQRTNPAAQQRYGKSCSADGQNTLQSVFPDFATPEARNLLSTLAVGELAEAELPVFFTSADSMVTRWNAALRRVECDGKIAIGIVLQHAGIDWQSRCRWLEAIARRDPLTGLGNRNQLLDRLEILLDGESHSSHQFAILFVDLDNFKMINPAFPR